MRIRFRLEAAEDVEGARAWYEEQQSGLGDAFAASLENVIDLVAEFPEAFPEIAAGHRRAHLHRFPYAVYYRLDSGVIDGSGLPPQLQVSGSLAIPSSGLVVG